MLKRRIKTLLKVLLALVVFLFAFLLFERVRGQISLARYKRELAAKGEKLTFRELIPPIPQGENAAPEVLEAIKHLQKGAVLPDRYPPKMKIMPSGRAVVGFREKEWIEDKVTNHWDQLAADLKTNEATLAQIRLALEKPVLNNKLDYSQGFKMRLEHLSPAKRLAMWLTAASQLALHENKPHEAVDNLVALIRLPRLLVEDRLVISEHVRIAIAAIARATTWEALQADGWTDEDLARIQQAWQGEDFMTAMARGLEGDRAFGQTTRAQLRHSNADVVEALFWQDYITWDDEPHRIWWHKPDKKEVYCRIWRCAWLHQEERHYLEAMQHLLEIARAATEAKSYRKILPLLEEFESKTKNSNFYDELRFPMSQQSLATLSKALQHAMRAETERSLTVCAIALKRYSLRYGKSPASLDSLVPEFLSSVPTDYMDGKPMKYHLNADGGFTLYSVGEDGKDDGGDTSMFPNKVHVRVLWERRDFVWPSPALPDEIEAYRQETGKN